MTRLAPGQRLPLAACRIWILAALLLPAASNGQTTDPINASLQFNFNNPGARSLGLGGAFTARADDATAVYANPSGLVQLSQPEISADFRNWEYSSPFLDSGTQIRAGDLEGLVFGERSDATRGPSFASAMHPSRNGRWVLGVFVHELANYRAEVHSQGATLPPDDKTFIVRPVDGIYDLDIGSLGFSAARRLTDRVSLGATLTYSEFSLASRVERWNRLKSEPRPLPTETVIEGDPEACCRFTERSDVKVYFTQTEDPEADDDVTATLGLLWQSRTRVRGAHLVTIGAVWRQGPTFGFRGDSFTQSTGRNSDGVLVRTFETQTNVPLNTILECRDPERPGCPGRFQVPDVVGLGVSLRPSLRWLVSLDVNRVSYSMLTESILDIDHADSALSPTLTVFGASGKPRDFRVEDGTEIRLGVEYGIYRERVLPDYFVRAGIWREPSHDMQYTGEDAKLQALWTDGSDAWHAAFGFGMRLRRFQLDAAVDTGQGFTTAALSSVYYFGR